MSTHLDSNKLTSGTQENLAHSLAAARGGDREAFSTLIEPHRLELMTHCYRMLGSVEDAEDLVQETFLKAWRGINTYEGRASFRAWLYKIATNTCLDALKSRPKRYLHPEFSTPVDLSAPLPAPIGSPTWIEPFPDDLLAPASSNPEAHYDAYEGISLAFLVALQDLPARQRSVLILKDVLDWSVEEIADTLETTQSSVTSLLHRARISMKHYHSAGRRDSYRRGSLDLATKQLIKRYMYAWESADIDGIVSLLTEDATFPMPPFPIWVQGKPVIKSFISKTILFNAAPNRWKLIAIHANGQPGFAFYQLDESSRTYSPFALQVLTIEDNAVSDVTTFGFPALFRFFNLPPVLEI